MNPSCATLKPVRCLDENVFKFDTSKFEYVYQNTAHKTMTEMSISVKGFVSNVQRNESVYVSNKGDWELHISTFTGFPSDVILEYAPTRNSFVEICSNYGFCEASCPKLVVNEHKVVKSTRKSKLYEGKLGMLPVVVKKSIGKKLHPIILCQS